MVYENQETVDLTSPEMQIAYNKVQANELLSLRKKFYKQFPINHNYDESFGDAVFREIKRFQTKNQKLETEIESQNEHIELLNQCDDSSTEVIGKMDNEIEQLQVENQRMRNALQTWIDINEGAPNKYQWAEQALKGDI